MAEKQFTLHTSNRTENLARRLVEVAEAAPLSRPLSQETVMTLNPGMARWLQFEIARHTGVSFGWEFPLPAKLFQRLLAAFEPDYETGGAFSEDEARWRLSELLEKLEDHPRFSLVRSYCQSSAPTRRLSFASRLARMYDEYLVYRPETVTDWEDDGSQYDWQAELWRRLLKALYPKQRRPCHIARIWRELARGSGAPAQPEALPERLFVFGVSSLAPLYLDLLDVVSRSIPVHLFLLQPSDLYWADLKTSKEIQRLAQRASRQGASLGVDPEDWLFETGNPLLPALGKQGQMFLDLLIDRDPIQDDSAFTPPEPVTQLGSLQADIFTLERRNLKAGDAPFPPYDGSLQIHACTTRRREIETLWDYLVQRLDSDPTLRPTDLLVMAPEIDSYRSHIDAVFGAKRGTSLEIPYTIADAASKGQSKVLSGLCQMLESCPGRASSAEILGLMETPLLREAFSFDDQDLERIEYWIRELGIAWGWGPDDRARHDGFPTARGTWRELKQRLAAGMAFAQEASLPEGFLAYSEVEGDLSDTAGRFLECLESLHQLRAAYFETRSIAAWQGRLLDLLESLRSPRDDWESQYRQAVELIRAALPPLDEVFATGAEAYHAVMDKLANAPASGGYLSGGLTFCSLKPMRSIPANTLCVIGLNRLDFPKRNTRLSFDLLAKAPRRGDRNAREESRQFFLETVLSCRSHLFLSYQGLAANSDTKQEPSVVLEELQAYLGQSLGEEECNKLRFFQKRQGYDPAYFDEGRFFTYDPDRAALRQRFDAATSVEEGESAPAPCSTPERDSNDEPIELESLIAFYRDPAKYFVQHCAKARLLRDEDALLEIDKLQGSGLDTYQLRQDFAEAIAAGEVLDESHLSRMVARKRLPPGHLETPSFLSELEAAQAIQRSLEPLRLEQRRAQAQLGATVLTGDAAIDAASGRQVLLFGGSLKPTRIIETWIRHLFAFLAVPDFCQHTLAITLKSETRAAPHLQFGPVEEARAALQALVDGFRQGQARPLPLLPLLSEPVYRACVKNGKPDEPAARESALVLARQRLAKSKETEKEDFPQADEWTAFDRMCFGENYEPDESFVAQAVAFWSPIAAASTPCKTEEIGAAP